MQDESNHRARVSVSAVFLQLGLTAQAAFYVWIACIEWRQARQFRHWLAAGMPAHQGILAPPTSALPHGVGTLIWILILASAAAWAFQCRRALPKQKGLLARPVLAALAMCGMVFDGLALFATASTSLLVAITATAFAFTTAGLSVLCMRRLTRDALPVLLGTRILVIVWSVVQLGTTLWPLLSRWVLVGEGLLQVALAQEGVAVFFATAAISRLLLAWTITGPTKCIATPATTMQPV